MLILPDTHVHQDFFFEKFNLSAFTIRLFLECNENTHNAKSLCMCVNQIGVVLS